ncbi:ribonuclease P/MRP protein subunit POP6 KNAG_0D03890 [Huiozyma naganishii CBS 8797]|uniref:DNA/RNA-binding protein Alba-like domain-containing protein n=1 Tax=Huiozyma naganishii (strain ATCC MYA-139 / BCRC 22969 / CBS 8797 / KCTC 17520 / NBRC 10181 / NCYC 3082 / Yp74L-3) TaxID=1071383 RepID=J7R5K2_HUIN7|nr:hypothetical protein KNAG_0D03890 [Kazachstania naganishii CBS 8797]CCK70135.1 hypothetical protein KNAG_0D03890 [Kazachstania naganishii CBS 8797]
MASTAHYHNEDTGIDLADQKSSFKYIEDRIIPQLLSKDEGVLSLVKFRKVTKNDKIKLSIDTLSKIDLKSNILSLCAYGPHIQKLLSIVEIFKGTLKGGDPFKQWNAINSFEVVKPGVNELLDKKLKVPILFIFITMDESMFSSPVFKKNNTGFTEQPI